MRTLDSYTVASHPAVEDEIALLTGHDLLFVTVSGSHLYGFESRDSDIDLRGAFVMPFAEHAGIFNKRETIEKRNDERGVLVETSLHDIGKFATLLLKGNGNALEQLFSPFVVYGRFVNGALTPTLRDLREIARPLLSRRSAAHYRGFAHGCWNDCMKTPTVKKLLYLYRTLLTGIHLMNGGEIESHLPTLLNYYDRAGEFAHVCDLIAMKRAGVESSGWKGRIETHENAYLDLQARLDAAALASPLPVDAPQTAKARLNAFVVEMRRP